MATRSRRGAGLGYRHAVDEIDPQLVAAARGDIPAAFTEVIAADIAPHGRAAVVLLDTAPDSGGYPYQVVCHMERGGWMEGMSGNAHGWTSTEAGEDEDLGVLTWWDDAPEGARIAILRVGDELTEVPVVDGYAFFVAWDVPCPEGDGFPELLRFS